MLSPERSVGGGGMRRRASARQRARQGSLPVAETRSGSGPRSGLEPGPREAGRREISVELESEKLFDGREQLPLVSRASSRSLYADWRRSGTLFGVHSPWLTVP